MQRYISSSHVSTRGFTVVELVTIVVILSILIAVAIDSVIGYQSSARDRERKADTGIITQVIERYYRTQAAVVGPTYPASSVGANTLTTIVNNADATKAPDQTSSSVVIAGSGSAQTPTVSQYIYQPLNIDGSLCTVAPCVKYKLYYRLEVTDEVVVINSLRQQ